MTLQTMTNDELFCYRHSLAQGSLHRFWIEDADRELLRRGFRYEDGAIVEVTDAVA